MSSRAPAPAEVARTVELHFVSGTLEIRPRDPALVSAQPRQADTSCRPPELFDLPACCRFDPRTRCFRAPARAYAEVVRELVRLGLPYDDSARAYGVLEHGLRVRRSARPFQSEAHRAWSQMSGRGLVVLPTGAGKSEVALLAIDSVRRDAIVVAPTLDLVTQWHELLRTRFGCEIGVLGGGEHVVRPLTVATYDSAHLHMDHLGARFGLIVFDECHHLPGASYAWAADACLAPFRLGLTATPERADGRHERLRDLIGPITYRRSVADLAGDYLADFKVERVLVELRDHERQAYEEARRIYRDFVVSEGLRMNRPDAWSQFVLRSSLSAEGRRAMQAYQRQKQLAFAAPSKLDYVERLLHVHRLDRVLLFTERNSSAYALARRFLVPVVTHQTKVSERAVILQDFAAGVYSVVATSKVLNEGVDLPDANVAIVLSGSGSAREHIQRLGRILRKKQDKMAVLYELVANDTSEVFTSRRRGRNLAPD